MARIYRRTVQKDLPDPDNHDGVITHLEPDILEYEVKWALESLTTNKASGGNGIPVELFQILKDDAMKVLHSMCQQVWKTNSGHRTGNGQFSFQSQWKGMPKDVQTTTQLHSFYMLAKSYSKFSKARLQQYMKHELPDIQARFRKGKGTKIKLPTSIVIKKQESFRKTSTSALSTLPKPLTVWITTNCGKFLERWEFQTTLPDSWEICMQVKRQQLELDMKQQTDSK